MKLETGEYPDPFSMLREDQLVPCHHSDLTGKKILVLAPHPDDETLGCGGSTALHVDAGDPVKVVFLTDGARGDVSGLEETGAYVALREKEAREACAALGVSDMEFWSFEDRLLHQARKEAIERLGVLIDAFGPDLVYAPSPLELHPDHRAAAYILWAAAKGRKHLDVAFYEVSAPVAGNLLVDITRVLDRKWKAVSAYQSQLRERPYADIAFSLNRFRSLTLGESVTHAEGFFLWNTALIDSHPDYAGLVDALFSRDLNLKLQGVDRGLASDRWDTGRSPLFSVIVATRNRRHMLGRALESVLSQTCQDFEIIVANDGGEDVSDLAESLGQRGKIELLTHPESRGVAAARNTALRAARGKYIAYLDDDDLYYPDHLETLKQALETGNHRAVYTDSHELTQAWITDRYETIGERVAFSEDFDENRLLIGNFMPTLNIGHDRLLLEEAGFFDESLDSHEDWDLWIRFSLKTDFFHVRKVTAAWTRRPDRTSKTTGDRAAFLNSLRRVYARYAHLVTDPGVREAQKAVERGLAAEVGGELGGDEDHRIRALTARIRSLEAELDTIRNSKVWRLAESFRRIVYGKALAKVPRLQEKLITWTNRTRESRKPEANPPMERKCPLGAGDSNEVGWAVPTMGLDTSCCASGGHSPPYRHSPVEEGAGGDSPVSSFQFPASTPYETYIENNRISPGLRNLLRDAVGRFRYTPVVSILMSVENPGEKWFRSAIDSVLAQIDPGWRLIVACHEEKRSCADEILQELRDDRIRLVTHSEEASSGIRVDPEWISGDFVFFMGCRDVLAENALFDVAALLQEDPQVDLLYGDEDYIDEDGRRREPFFKPAWSPELLLSYNYLGRCVCIRKEVLARVGGFSIHPDSENLYPLYLRISEVTDRVRGIPRVLYHRRTVDPGRLLFPESGQDPAGIGLAALREHLRRKGACAVPGRAELSLSDGAPVFRLDWPDDGPSVAILISSRNQPALLSRCIESIREKTTYRSYRVVVIDNGSDNPEALALLRRLREDGVEIIEIGNEGMGFSFSRVHNRAVREVASDFILFLNDDTEVIEPKWLSSMAGYLSLPGVGVAGARLLYPDGAVQHAGVVLGMRNGMVPDHAFAGFPAHDPGYGGYARVTRNCSAVTGACLMTRRSDFIRLGGFNEADLPLTLQDVEYCLRMAGEGLRTVYVAEAELTHRESATRVKGADDPAELAYLRKNYPVNRDPFYNPNFSATHGFDLDTGNRLAVYGRFLKAPLTIMALTRSLRPEDGARQMLGMVKGLNVRLGERIRFHVFSGEWGTMGKLFQESGIPVALLDEKCPASGLPEENRANRLEGLLENEKPDLLIAQSLEHAEAVNAACRRKIPVVWMISESGTPPELRQRSALSMADEVVFGSAATRQAYVSMLQRDDFRLIHPAVDGFEIESYIQRESREDARRKIGVLQDKKVILSVGNICERKNQRVLVEAAINLRKRRDDFCVFLVGAREPESAYLHEISRRIEETGLSQDIRIIQETPDVFPYYRAGDTFVFPSKAECYPLATYEAMGFGLPVITTVNGGVREQVRDLNALFFEPEDENALGAHLERVLDDENLMVRLGKNSRHIFEYLPNYEEMIQAFGDLILGVAMTRTQTLSGWSPDLQ